MSFNLSLKESSMAKRARVIAEAPRPAEAAFAAQEDSSELSDVQQEAAPELGRLLLILSDFCCP